MVHPLSRRRVIHLGGAGASLSVLGGFSTTEDETDDESNDTTGDDDTDADDTETADDQATVAIGVTVDQDEFAEIQEEIFEQVQEGELDQIEAQAELEEVQMELLAESMAALEERADETDDLTITDTQPEIGLALVDGTPAALIETLDIEEVAALIPSEEFEDVAADEEAEADDTVDEEAEADDTVDEEAEADDVEEDDDEADT